MQSVHQQVEEFIALGVAQVVAGQSQVHVEELRTLGEVQVNEHAIEAPQTHVVELSVQPEGQVVAGHSQAQVDVLKTV